MKNVAIAGIILMLFAAAAPAAELAVSASTLGTMGLAGMQQLSDSEGATVRGKGTFANVWGGSHAEWAITSTSTDAWGHTTTTSTPVAVSENSYEAGASWLGYASHAGGNSLSFAAAVDIDFAADSGPQPGNMQGFLLQVHVAGGVSGGGANAWAN